MTEDNRRIKLIAFSFIVTVVISSGFLLMNMYDYIGLLNSLKKIDVSVSDVVINSVGEDIEITLILTVINPSSYTRLKLSSIQSHLYLNVDGREVYMGTIAYSPPFSKPLIPNLQASCNATLLIPNTKNQFFSQHATTSELNWRIKCVINLETPIRRYHTIIHISAKSSSSSHA